MERGKQRVPCGQGAWKEVVVRPRGVLNRCPLQTVSVKFKNFRRYSYLSTQCSPVWVPPVSSTSSRLGLGSLQTLEQPLWFPSAQKKRKHKGKRVVSLWHVAPLYSVFCDGLLNNLTTFWWVPGKLAYDKFYIEKREIATKKSWCQTGSHFRKKKILVLIFLKVHNKFWIICYLKSYAGIIFFLIPNKMCHWEKVGKYEILSQDHYDILREYPND